MALTTDRADIERALAELDRTSPPEGVAELAKRMDALLEAVEILARDHYEHPGLSESRLRDALTRARRPDPRRRVQANRRLPDPGV
jgi:hypothetical protein